MNGHLAHRIIKAALAGAVLLSQQACTPSTQPGNPVASVSDAYHASDVVAVQPYTRTIFSSNNF